MESNTSERSRNLATRSSAGVVAGLCLLAGASTAQAPTYTNFESFTPNVSVNGQGGWLATGAWDEEVVDDGSTTNQAWRVSNYATSGSFGDMPFAPGSDLYAGESGSMHAFDGGAGPVTNRYYASFDFWSVTGAPQPGLDVTVSPDDGGGARQSFLSIEDNGAGIDLEFFDSQANHPTSNPNGGFVSTDVVTGLSYGDKHTVAFDITFVDGNDIDGGGFVYGNDIVKIIVDGVVVHTGTTWESYWWTTTEGQTPPSKRAIDTLLFRLSTPGPASLLGDGYYIDNVYIGSTCPDDFQGFEVDTSGWGVFSSPVYDATRVPSGTNGVTSAAGSWHAIAPVGNVPAGNWGGYSATCDCASSSCATGPFPAHGYTTSVDIYLDMGAGYADDSRFDFDSAINKPDGTHRRDFIFAGGFYSAGNTTAPTGGGVDRFIFSSSNNAPGWPANPAEAPVAITSSGWYTFEHRFRPSGGGVLAVDMTIRDTSGTAVATWTRSTPSDVIATTVGGNRYAWFPTVQIPDLAFDNALRITGGDAELALSAADCQDDAYPGESGYQIEVQLEMLNLTSLASGFQAFVDYPMGSLMYRGDLSSYSGSPFSLHIADINQLDDGTLELDGSAGFGDPASSDDSLLATLVFDVLVDCVPVVPATFAVGGAFESELSYEGLPLTTALTDSTVITPDDTPPVLGACPSNITQSADAGLCTGAVVTWTDPTATDTCDPSPTVVCSPPSGSFFPVGTTTVTCTATDACGNTDTCTFDVTVTATNDVDVTVILTGSQPTSRCIHFQTDSCSAVSDETLTFLGGPSATAVTTIQVPCGVWTQLCAKDEQHTKWGNVALNLVGTKYVAAAPIVLDGGDSDNDGDIDINDVTLFLAQFGNGAAFGGCPWDGVTRDTDFNNGGIVGSEDYSYLTAGWLTTSSCACYLPLEAGDRPAVEQWVRVTDAMTSAADLNGDGRVDVRDVELFEKSNRLSGELSARMRATQR